MRKPHLMTGGRYPVLRSVAILSLICAALAALATIVATGWVLVQLGDLSFWRRVVMSFSILGGGFFAVIAILVFAEVVELFIDMATSLRTLAQRQSGATENPADAMDEVPAELAILRGR